MKSTIKALPKPEAEGHYLPSVAYAYDPAIKRAALSLSSMGYSDRQVQSMTGVEHSLICKWRGSADPGEFKALGDAMRSEIEGTSKGIVANIVEGYSRLVPQLLAAAEEKLASGAKSGEVKDMIVCLALMYDKACMSSGYARRNDQGFAQREAKLQQTNIQIVLPDNGRGDTRGPNIVDAPSYTVDS